MPRPVGVSSYHFLADVDVVGLNVEDELILGPMFLEGLGVVDLLGVDLVAVAEDLVESHERGGHAAAASQGSRGGSIPDAWQLRSLISASRSSYCFCSADWGGGTNSSLEAIRDGIGGRKSFSASRSHLRTHIDATPSQKRNDFLGPHPALFLPGWQTFDSRLAGTTREPARRSNLHRNDGDPPGVTRLGFSPMETARQKERQAEA